MPSVAKLSLNEELFEPMRPSRRRPPAPMPRSLSSVLATRSPGCFGRASSPLWVEPQPPPVAL